MLHWDSRNCLLYLSPRWSLLWRPPTPPPHWAALPHPLWAETSAELSCPADTDRVSNQRVWDTTRWTPWSYTSGDCWLHTHVRPCFSIDILLQTWMIQGEELLSGAKEDPTTLFTEWILNARLCPTHRMLGVSVGLWRKAVATLKW